MEEDQINETSEGTTEGPEAENNQSSNQASEQSVKESRPGYSPVDLSDLPPEKQKVIEDRINYLYRQVKDGEKTKHEYRSIAEQQSRAIEELMSGVGQVVDHIQTRDTTDLENATRQKMREAFEVGDTVNYLAEQEKLNDIKQDKKIQKILKDQQKPAKTETQKMANAGYKSADQIAQDGVSDGEFTQEDAYYVKTWQDETDQSGKALRPWARTDDPNDPDPDYVKALVIAQKVWKTNPNLTPAQKLAEVDKRMGMQSRSPGQNVMGGSLTNRTNKSKVTLSPAAERIAVKTKFGGPKAKSDADHIDAYRKQMEKVQSSKGSR